MQYLINIIIYKGEAWVRTYQDVYLTPLNIPSNQRVSWNAETVKAIKAKNPSLANVSFLIPRQSGRPFPIVGSTLIGPEEGAPYDYGENRNLTMFEMTPLYVGSLNSSE